jgi:2-keto-4-pentenoate hydratase
MSAHLAPLLHAARRNGVRAALGDEWPVSEEPELKGRGDEPSGHERGRGRERRGSEGGGKEAFEGDIRREGGEQARGGSTSALTLDDAYVVHEELARLAGIDLARGVTELGEAILPANPNESPDDGEREAPDAVFGWAIGAPQESSRRTLGLSEPFFVPLFTQFVHDGSGGRAVPRVRLPESDEETGRGSRLPAAALEAAFAVYLRKDLPPRGVSVDVDMRGCTGVAPYTREEIVDAIGSVGPALQLIRPRFALPEPIAEASDATATVDTKQKDTSGGEDGEDALFKVGARPFSVASALGLEGAGPLVVADDGASEAVVLGTDNTKWRDYFTGASHSVKLSLRKSGFVRFQPLAHGIVGDVETCDPVGAVLWLANHREWHRATRSRFLQAGAVFSPCLGVLLACCSSPGLTSSPGCVSYLSQATWC